MRDLTEAERGEIIGLYKSGATYKSISKELGFPITTVFRTVKNFKERKSVSNLPKSGRPKILNTNHQKKLKKIVKQILKGSQDVLMLYYNRKI